LSCPKSNGGVAESTIASASDANRSLWQLVGAIAPVNLLKSLVQALVSFAIPFAHESAAMKEWLNPDLRDQLHTLHVSGHFLEIESVCEKAAEESLRTHGKLSLCSANAVEDWAWALYLRGKLPEAIQRQNEALSTYKEICGDASKNVARCLNKIGQMRLRVGDAFALVEPYCQNALDIIRSLPAKEQAGLGAALSNLAHVRARQGRFAESLEFLREALRFRISWGGPGHPKVGQGCEQLAHFYHTRGKLRVAQKFINLAIQIYRDADYSTGPEFDGMVAFAVRIESDLNGRNTATLTSRP
jgi:tetratricopeptide (TPR) repeat protein